MIGVLEMRRAFRDGTLDPYDALQERVGIADACEPWLHAFAYRPPAASLRIEPGPLGGIPIGVKDIIATSDMPTTNGSPIFRDHVPAHDAAIVQRIRALGGIVFGKTVTTEFAWRHPGPTVNPHHRSHTPGGSSSGSAAAVAAGIVPLALGTQTVGSIIRPAAFCGVVGFKPSFGTLPLDGVHPFAPSLDHLGLFARRVDDITYAVGLLSRDGASLSNDHVPPPENALATGINAPAAPRLLFVTTSRWHMVDAEQKAVLQESADLFASAGAIIDHAELPAAFEDVWGLLQVILASEAAGGFGKIVASHPGQTSPALQKIVEEGRHILPAALAEARAAQTHLRGMLTAVLKDFDALLMVPAPGEAPAGLEDTGDATFCAPWSFTGVPAITLPAGWSRNGLPLGIQLVGAWQNDQALLRTTMWVETRLQWQTRPIG